MIKKKHIRDITGLGIASIGLGLGSDIVEKAGGNAGALGNISKFTPALGTMIGGSIMIDTLMDINTDLNKKLKRKRL